MDGRLNHAPCGFLTLSEKGKIVSINQTLLSILDYHMDQLNGKSINSILSVPSQMFYQFYFVPLLKVKGKIEELYISLESSSKREIPVIVNAVQQTLNGETVTNCILFPIRQRSEYENELLIAKKNAEAALVEKHQANEALERALTKLKHKQEKLLELYEQTSRELELARTIQKTSLTKPILTNDIQIEAFHQASSELSGDIYGFYQIDKHRYGVILLDVMGHGISSALITMSLHSLFQRLISFGMNTKTVMKELDDHLHNLFQDYEEVRHYCTAIYLLIDTKKQEIEYCNAGHPPAFWQDLQRNQQELGATNVPIGMFEEVDYNNKTISYSPGDRLLLYTDGVGEPLGTGHLATLLSESTTSPLVQLKENITDSIATQGNSHQQDDDQCFILIELK